MKLKKFLFLLHYPPPIHGAAMIGNYIRNSKIINSQFNIRYINLGISTSIDDIGKTGFAKLTRYIWLLIHVFKQMLVFRPEIAYMTLTAKGYGFYKDAIVVLLAKLMGAKMVYHFHNKGVQTRQHKPFDNWLYKKVFKNAEVILLSEYLYPDVEKYVSRERVYICPNGIPDQISDSGECQEETGPEPVQLLFLSNLIESKGVFVLLEACNILKSKNIPFTCVFVGGEGDITAKQLNDKFIELGLEKEVSYAGRKYGKEKEVFFSSSDVFVLPTTKDCFPLVLLEAMKYSLPVVSTVEGGIPDIILDGKNGFLVPKQDVKALANRLEELICHVHKRRKMGQLGREIFIKNFTLEKFEMNFKEILLGMC